MLATSRSLWQGLRHGREPSNVTAHGQVQQGRNSGSEAATQGYPRWIFCFHDAQTCRRELTPHPTCKFSIGNLLPNRYHRRLVMRLRSAPYALIRNSAFFHIPLKVSSWRQTNNNSTRLE